MPLVGFICDYDKEKISFADCFTFCRKWNEVGGSPRCLPLPILKSMGWDRPKTAEDYLTNKTSVTVTQLCSATYQTMQKIYHDYWVHPFDLMYMAQGKAGHYYLQKDSPNQLQEERITDDICSGQIDLFDGDTEILYDYKYIGTYKAGIINDNSDSIEEYYRQINRYASLLKGKGFNVKQMVLCAVIRDWRKWEYLTALQMQGKVRVKGGNAGKPYAQAIPPVMQYQVPVIPDNDEWFKTKKRMLLDALQTKDCDVCGSIERWNEDKRCTEYAFCPTREHCKYYQQTYKKE
jgi:hypothetical protein